MIRMMNQMNMFDDAKEKTEKEISSAVAEFINKTNVPVSWVNIYVEEDFIAKLKEG